MKLFEKNVICPYIQNMIQQTYQKNKNISFLNYYKKPIKT
jgi:hypothetical protein